MKRLIVLFSLLWMSPSGAAAQLPTPEDLKGLHDVSGPMSRLDPRDRHEIVQRLRIDASHLRGESVHGEGEESFVVQAYSSDLCSPTGNCSLWVFDADHQYLLAGTSAQQYSYLSESHAGRRDLLTEMHSSAFDSGLTVWRFDGRRYRKSVCAYVRWAGPDGKVYKHPKITAESCS